MSSLKSSHRLVSFLAGLGIGALLLAALLLLTGCASTGQLAGAGCTYNLCGQLCCANDGKVCPLCDEWWKIPVEEEE